MTRAIVIRAHGGIEQLKLEDVEVGDPGPGQIRIRQHAIGLNFIDTYQRSGLYKPALPFIGGNEAAGEVTAVGPGVTLWQVGQRVAYTGAIGAYAEERLLPADRAVPLPDEISFEAAAAALLKGTTAYYLLFRTHAVQPGETVLIHAAAGGTGSILVQWAKALGAKVVATAGSPEKLAEAKAHGADLTINYKTEEFAAAAREFTGGQGVDVVYDGVGKATFEKSLDSLRPLGLMVSFGNASGPVSIPSLGILADKGSLFLTRPTSGTYFKKGDDLRVAAKALFQAMAAGEVRVGINRRFPLAEVQQATAALEGRGTTGSTILLP